MAGTQPWINICWFLRWIHWQVPHWNETLWVQVFFLVSLHEQRNALIATTSSSGRALKVCRGCGWLFQAEARWVRGSSCLCMEILPWRPLKALAKRGIGWPTLAWLWVAKVKSHSNGICWITLRGLLVQSSVWVQGNQCRPITLTVCLPHWVMFKLPCLQYPSYRMR